MKINDKNCNYPVINRYFSETEFEEALKHIEKCNSCLDLIIQQDRNLILNRINKKNEEIIPDENKFAMESEKLMESLKSGQQNGVNLKNMELLGHMVNFLNLYEKSEILKTPEYLKNMIMRDLQKEQNMQQNSLIIKISDGFKVICNFIENMIEIPGEMVPVVVRSKKNQEDKGGSLNFVQIMDKNEAHYSIVKDGLSSVVLTVSFKHEQIKPDYVQLKSLNQIIQSQRPENNLVYFSKLKKGNYCIEFKYRNQVEMVAMPITLL